MRRFTALDVARPDAVQIIRRYFGSFRSRLGPVGAFESTRTALLGVLVDIERVALLRLVDGPAKE